MKIAEETAHDIFMKRIQRLIWMLAGVVTLIVGVYNAKRALLAQLGEFVIKNLVLITAGLVIGSTVR